MRILFVANRYPPARGGAEIVEQRLAEGLVAKGHQVVVLTTNFQNSHGHERIHEKEPLGSGVMVHRSHGWRLKKDPLTYSHSMFSWIKRNHRDFDVLVTFAYGYPITFLPVLMKKLGLIDIPIVMHPHYAPNENFPDFLLWSYDQTFGMMSARGSDKIVLLTDYYREFFDKKLDVPGRNIHILPPIVPQIPKSADTEIKEVSERFKIPEGKKYLFSASRLVEYKGVQFIIKALDKMRSVNESLFEQLHLIVASDGDYRAELEKLTIEKDLREKVTFTGFVSENEKNALYNMSDLFLLLSYSGESFGIVLVEAMSAGLPVIGSDKGAIPAVINEGKSGFVVDPFDIEEVAVSISKIMAKENYTSFSDKAKEDSVLYSSEEVIKGYEEILSEL